MKFSKYPSISNSYVSKNVDAAKAVSSDITFIVQEKIHGSNFSLWCDGTDVKAARRGDFLKADDKFHGFHAILDQYRDAMMDLFANIQDVTDKVHTVTVHGELFGGSYPHPDVPVNNKVSKVQASVFYCPDVKFLAFDLDINGNRAPAKLTNDVLGAHDIPVCPVLFQGSLDDCLAFSNQFQTTIPDMFGLPAIDGNTCEGVVVKPLTVGDTDLVFKNKNSKFTEKQRVKKTQAVVSNRQAAMQQAIACYVTKARLDNVVSKQLQLTQQDIGRLVGLLAQDALGDFQVDCGLDYQNLSKADRNAVKSFLKRQCSNLIRANLADILG